ncbi:uncharacterized protein LOC106651492 [Trichogramma pretiosum]|uniref:uncharacterized protein LOC106651492 n=1 Tax=Trichogramma pretiosum TaxID=7493 RepID=UPI0006C9B5E8|nr:uncharacterized protein LOC106651492 [Trichogramma pretiosum]
MPAADSYTLSRPRRKSSAKAVGQVMTAMKNIKTAVGPTMTEIVKFISGALYDPVTKRQVVAALKRGVEFGILKRHRGHYLISSPDETLAPSRKIAGGGKVQKRRSRPSTSTTPPNRCISPDDE